MVTFYPHIGERSGRQNFPNAGPNGFNLCVFLVGIGKRCGKNLCEDRFSPPACVLKLWQRQQLVPPSATPPREISLVRHKMSIVQNICV